MEGRDPNTGRFLTGNNGGPGRPKGARAKLGEAFLAALAKDFEKANAEDPSLGEAAIEQMRIDKPNEYAKMIASLLPKEIGGPDGEDIPITTKIILEGVSSDSGAASDT